jgi:hypothetical protein
MKRLLAILAAVCAAVPLAAAALEFPADRIIQPPESYKRQSAWVGPVEFPHYRHTRHTSCGQCHHKETDQSTKNGEYMACGMCHNGPEKPNETGFYGAWHSQSDRSCVGCHMDQPLDTQPVPPKGCTTGCHQYGEEQGDAS